MKKRLLSAFLALAMVLTLLPATAFAATTKVDETNPNQNPNEVQYVSNATTGETKYYYAVDGNKVTTVSVTYQAASDPATGRIAGNWYWTASKGDSSNAQDPKQAVYFAATSGVVASNGNSGQWYPTIAALLRSDSSGATTGIASTTLTLLDDASLADISAVLADDTRYGLTSLTIDVNGNGLTMPAKLPDKLATLTITDRLSPLKRPGSVQGSIVKDIDEQTYIASHPYSALNLTISNVAVTGGISLMGGANRVTLYNATVGGDITMSGQFRKQASGGAWGAYSYPGQQLNINTTDTGNVSTTASVTGAISVSGDSSTVKLNNLTGATSLTVTGNAGTVTVDGATSIGPVTVGSREGDNAAIPTVTINGGSVGAITRDDSTNETKQANQVTINAGATAYSIVSSNGKVTVNQGNITDAIVVDEGSVDLKGPVVVGATNKGAGSVNAPTADANALKLGATGKTTLSISGNGSVIGGVTAVKPANLTISQWPAGRENYFGTLALDTYTGRGVKGGRFAVDTDAANTFADEDHAHWFSTDLQLVVDTGSIMAGTVSLYGKNEMARAISDITSIAAGVHPKAMMHILCQESTYTLVLSNGNINWAEIGYDKPTGMILPTEINGFGIAKWISGDNDASVPSGSEQIIPKPSANNVFKLLANDVAPTVAKTITKAAPSENNIVENQHVKVTLNGTNIQISGAVTPAPGSNIATILLDLTTDALEAGGPTAPASGQYVVLEDVQVFYNVDTKAVGFNRLQAIDGGAIVNDAGELVLNNGTGTHYTVSASLSQSATNLGIYQDTPADMIQATVGGNLARRTQTDKDNIIAQIAGSGAYFDINGNRAVQEAINAVQATITSNNSVDGWVTNARNYVWKNGNQYLNAKGQPNGLGKGDPNDVIKPHTGNFSTTGTFGADGVKIDNKYAKAYIVPYLVVNATDLNQNGTLTATLTVYYRVDVSAATYNPKEYYTVQAGRPLGALTGDMTTPVLVKFSTNPSAFSGTTYMHQDGKYVYTKGSYTTEGGAADASTWGIDHAGTGNGSLGTVVLNMTDGPITLKRAGAAAVLPTKYDTLQAAIDDTQPGWVNNINGGGGQAPNEVMDTVEIGGTYAETSCVVTMTGVARKISVVSNGNRKITSNTKDVDVQSYNGYTYTIQLQKDAVATGTVAIAVTATGNGTASANRSSAKPGEVVTVTVVPAVGQAASVTAKTNSGASVSVTGTGVANQYKFTVPQNATSVTVTASFGKATAANLTVNTTNNGIAVASASTVYGGETVTITTRPSAGYRATGVTVSTNAGTVSATRTAENTYIFTVPANATYVTVTPTFAADTGLPFVDVPANDFYLDAVKFVYEKGLMNGITATTFGGSRTITRGQIVTMLYRLSGSPASSNYSSFQDVPANEYYAPAVTWAANNGIVNGRNGTTFAPNDAITRQELATILYRYTSFRGLVNNKTASLNGYTDQGQVDSYAVAAMQWCVGNGIMNGTSNTTLTPRGTAQRYQAAIMLMRYCQSFLGM